MARAAGFNLLLLVFLRPPESQRERGASLRPVPQQPTVCQVAIVGALDRLYLEFQVRASLRDCRDGDLPAS